MYWTHRTRCILSHPCTAQSSEELQGQENRESTLEFSHMVWHYYSIPTLCLPFSSNFSTAEKPISCYWASLFINLCEVLWAGSTGLLMEPRTLPLPDQLWSKWASGKYFSSRCESCLYLSPMCCSGPWVDELKSPPRKKGTTGVR